MKKFCDDNSISQVFTIPGNPQSNGKIEKFWPPLSKRIKDAKSWDEIYLIIDKYINDYNFRIPHNSLEKGIGGVNSYPCEVFEKEDLQATDLNTSFITIDNKGTLPLSVFIRQMSQEEYEQLKNKDITEEASILSIDSLLNKK